ncbi:hypothetical protein HDV06_006247 [Boothiomyces sp. JEL0866]|nr:hypothetical protein HDV06_006247 [Boothiomyces sp. JEL0866]
MTDNISSLLEDLLNMEQNLGVDGQYEGEEKKDEQLNISTNIQTQENPLASSRSLQTAKSVSFLEKEDLITTITFEPEEPSNNIRSSVTKNDEGNFTPTSILKQPQVLVEPTELPMQPEDESFDSDFSTTDSGSLSDDSDAEYSPDESTEDENVQPIYSEKKEELEIKTIIKPDTIDTESDDDQPLTATRNTFSGQKTPTLYGQPIEVTPKLYGQSIEPPTLYGQAVETPTLYGQPIEPPTLYGQAVEPPTLYGQAVEPPTLYGQAVETPTLYGQPIEPPTLYGQPIEPYPQYIPSQGDFKKKPHERRTTIEDGSTETESEESDSDLPLMATRTMSQDSGKQPTFFGQPIVSDPAPAKVAINTRPPITLADGSSDDDEPILSPKAMDEIKRQREQSLREEEKLDRLEDERRRKESITEKKDVNMKKITCRIFIENAGNFTTKVLTSLMQASTVVEDISANLQGDNWALFEIITEFGIERPLRNWEIVTDVMSTWDTEANNAIVLKKYGYINSLSPASLKGRYPRIQGYMYFETKIGKWSKKFFILNDYKLCYYADGTNSGPEVVFCDLSQFDVYTLMRPRKKSITDFCFALKSDLNSSFFQDINDSAKFVCVEKPERLADWCLALRLAKSEYMWENRAKVSTPSQPKEPLVNTIQPSTLTPGSLLENHVPEPVNLVEHVKQITPGSLLERSDKPSEKKKKKKSESDKEKKKHRSESAGEHRFKRSESYEEDKIRRSKSESQQEEKIKKKKEKKEKSDKDKKRKVKPLVDISGTKNCKTCGCSEFVPVPSRREICANCYHDHKQVI